MIAERFRKAADDYAGRTACRVGAETISYAELRRRAEAVGDLLRRQGTSPVVLRGNHCIDEITALAACLMARRAYVPVSVSVPEERFAEILRATGAGLVLTFGGATEIGCDHAEVLTLSGLEKYRGSEPLFGENDIAYYIFTSGSTGTPKGVSVSYGNLENFIGWIGGLEPLSGYRGINVLNQASLGFDLSVADVYYALCNGHTWVASPDGYSDVTVGMADRFRSNGIHVAVMTPSALKLCLLEEDFSRAGIPSLQAIFFCGERLEKKPVRKLFERFPGIAVINAYGPTEATCAVCAVRITIAMAEADGELPVGEISSAATEIRIEDGEIVLLGPSVFRGYADGRSGGHFTKDGQNGYRTGDLGYVREGLLYCTGRSDNQVKYKGYRIELEEIECALSRLPGISECVVIAKKTADGIVKTIQAYVVPENGDVAAEEIKQALRATLPEYMIPKTIVTVDRLPRNANGKTDRKALANR